MSRVFIGVQTGGLIPGGDLTSSGRIEEADTGDLSPCVLRPFLLFSPVKESEKVGFREGQTPKDLSRRVPDKDWYLPPPPK